MKKLPLTLITLMTILIAAPVSRAEIVERVVAVVNDEVITQSELDFFLRPFYEQFQNTYKGEELLFKLTEARRNLLNQLIEDKLVYQEAKRKEIQVNEQEIDEEVNNFKKRFKSEGDFTRLTTAQGMTLTKLRERYRQQIASRRIHFIEVRSRVLVSPKEIEDYYQENISQFNQAETVKLRSLTIRKAPDKTGKQDDDAKAKADQILADLKKGADFGKVAEAHSEDHHAANGGDLGYVGRGDLARTIDEVVFALKPGDLSPVIETEIGYHIFKVEDRKEGKKRTLDESRKEIQEILFRKNTQKRFQEWMKELKSKAYISIR